MMRFYPNIQTVCYNRWAFLTASLLLAAIFIAFAPFLKVIYDVGFYLKQDHPAVTFYESFKKEFGEDEFFVVAFEKKDIFTKENLELIRRITADIEGNEQVRSVLSLGNVETITGSQDVVEIKQFLEDIPDDESSLAVLRNEAINNPLYAGNIISDDGRTAAIIVYAYDRSDDAYYRERLVGEVTAILKKYEKETGPYKMAGWTVTSLNIGKYMIKDILIFAPITLTVLTLILIVFFRNTRLVVAALLNIMLCTGSTIGLMGLTGVSLNLITTIIIPLVMALTLCSTVHIYSHLDANILKRTIDKNAALAEVVSSVVKPCFLTSLTTAIGFLSLTISKLEAIREFAVITASGMGFGFIFSFFFLPPFLLFFRPEKIYREYKDGKGLNRVLNAVSVFTVKKRRLILVCSGTVVLIALWFITQIDVETNPVESFKKTSSIRQSINFIEEKLSGIGSLDISLKAHEVDAFKNPSYLKAIERLQNYIKTLPQVDVTMSFVDFLKTMNKALHNDDQDYYTIPDSREAVAQYIFIFNSNDIAHFVNDSFDHARISVRISEHGSTAQKRMIRQIQDFASGLGARDLDITITGRTVQNVISIDTMVNGQVYSLTIAAVLIGLIMFLALKSVRMGFISLVPNIFPILINFGLMGAFGISLNTGTALIAAVALGIAVDDTIHFLTGYKEKRADGCPTPEALRLVTVNKGRAILLSSLILTFGFGVCSLSRFIPTAQFGMLCAIIMVTALIGDLIILPAVVLIGKQPEE